MKPGRIPESSRRLVLQEWKSALLGAGYIFEVTRMPLGIAALFGYRVALGQDSSPAPYLKNYFCRRKEVDKHEGEVF